MQKHICRHSGLYGRRSIIDVAACSAALLVNGSAWLSIPVSTGPPFSYCQHTCVSACAFVHVCVQIDRHTEKTTDNEPHADRPCGNTKGPSVDYEKVCVPQIHPILSGTSTLTWKEHPGNNLLDRLLDFTFNILALSLFFFRPQVKHCTSASQYNKI